MQPTLFGALLAIIGIWCQFGSYHRTLIVMIALTVFGAASAVDLPALGGASVAPSNLFLLFLLLRLISMRDGLTLLIAEIAPRRPLFIYLLLVIWIFGSAILLPRLFDGTTNVFSLSRSDDSDGTSPLHPTSGNLSQTGYAIGGFLVAGAISAFARKPGATAALISGLILVTSLDIGFAILDIITNATHTGFILDIIHTANYAFLTDDELGGLKRISGSFPEASIFATYTLTLLGVNAALFVCDVRSRFTGFATAALTALVGLSTSSAGYAGLGVFYAVFLSYALGVGLLFHRKRLVAIAVGAIFTGLSMVSIVILFLPAVSNVAQKVVTDSLLTKGTSDSAIERGSWNAQALQVFQDTHWLGAGIGSTRGSNYALVLLSNLGAIGFGLFVLLLLRTLIGRIARTIPNDRRGLIWAARIGILVPLVPNMLVGTVYDLGTLFYILVGIAASGVVTSYDPVPAVASPRRDPQKVRQPAVQRPRPAHRPAYADLRHQRSSR